MINKSSTADLDKLSPVQVDHYWMTLALNQAKKAEELAEVPVGAVLVKDDQLIAQAHNQPISANDPTAHAEIQLLRAAGKKLNNYRLPNTTLYVTLEPCTMCLGAMIHARISRVVFGAYDQKTGVCGSCQDLSASDCFNHTIEVEGGILVDECKNLLQKFFKNRRKKK
jgi:tRNA(adenine34) deaminase